MTRSTSKRWGGPLYAAVFELGVLAGRCLLRGVFEVGDLVGRRVPRDGVGARGRNSSSRSGGW